MERIIDNVRYEYERVNTGVEGHLGEGVQRDGRAGNQLKLGKQ